MSPHPVWSRRRQRASKLAHVLYAFVLRITLPALLQLRSGLQHKQLARSPSAPGRMPPLTTRKQAETPRREATTPPTDAPTAPVMLQAKLCRGGAAGGAGRELCSQPLRKQLPLHARGRLEAAGCIPCTACWRHALPIAPINGGRQVQLVGRHQHRHQRLAGCGWGGPGR